MGVDREGGKREGYRVFMGREEDVLEKKRGRWLALESSISGWIGSGIRFWCFWAAKISAVSLARIEREPSSKGSEFAFEGESITDKRVYSFEKKK